MRQVAWVVVVHPVRAVRASRSSCRRAGCRCRRMRDLVLDRRLHVVVIYSLVTLGLGLLIGRVGLVSLCQFVLLVGRRVGRGPLRPAVALASRSRGAARSRASSPALIGTLIGLPALRLSGLYLALITLMAAGGHHRAAQDRSSSRTAAAASGATPRAAVPSRRSAGRRSRTATPPSTATASCVADRHVPHRVLAREGASRGEPGRRSARARPRRCRPACARPSTSCGRSRSPRSSPASPAACSPSPPRREHQPVPDAALDHDLRRHARRRRVHAGRRGRRRRSCSGSCRRSSSSGASASSCFTILFGRRHPPGAAHRARRHREQVPHDFGNLGKKLIGAVTGKNKAAKVDAPVAAPAVVPNVEAVEPTS